MTGRAITAGFKDLQPPAKSDVASAITVRRVPAEAMTEEGFTVSCSGNGLQALEALRSGLRPDLILLDLMMPVMDGWQFRKEQKQDAEIAGIPLVVITATGKRPVLIDAAELVMKPLDLTQLFAAIERYCH